MKGLAEDSANIEKLVDTENFPIWKFQVSVLLRANELYETMEREPGDSLKDVQWKKKDALAQKVLVTTVDKKPLMHIMDCKTAHEMWNKISTIYERDNEQQKCNLLQAFYNQTFDKNTDVATYISKLRNIATRLNAMNMKFEDQMVVLKILATLPTEYKHFASAWESTPGAEKTLENLTARLISEEMRNTDRQSEEKAVAYKATNKKCHKCNKTRPYNKRL